ncbi:hypothetical protein JHK87_017941 [Glycine soja]|nr:hypothetical protein JHK87_017941 [Glycine soja]
MAQRAQSVLATKDVFQKGDFHWKQFNVETSSASSSTPKPLLIFTPIVPGSYPVILFCHGFFIHNSFYSEFLGHIALHGFILVAPQLKANFVSPPCAPDGENHKEFFNECKPSCAHFVATDNLVGPILSNCVCKDGIDPRDSMRRAVGGLVVAFLRAQLNNLWKDFNAILADPYLALP